MVSRKSMIEKSPGSCFKVPLRDLCGGSLAQAWKPLQRGRSGQGGSQWLEQWWCEHWKTLLPTQAAPLLLVSAIVKGSHSLLSAMELAGRKTIPDMLGQVRAGCLVSQLSLCLQLVCHWFS